MTLLIRVCKSNEQFDMYGADVFVHKVVRVVGGKEETEDGRGIVRSS